uniref:Microprocessor complex subunit DGCR8 n=1 Tax=Globodera rostochiensis TaxID=31243 RepID=A0A914H1J6_GLORO
MSSNDEKELDEKSLITNDDEDDLAKLEEMRKCLLDQLRQEEQEEDDNQQLDAKYTKEDRTGLDEHLTDCNEDREEEQPGHLEQSVQEDSSSTINTSDEELFEEDGSTSVGPDIKYDEIDTMLEQPMEQANENGDRPKHISKKFKRVLEFRGMDHFDVLPDGWVEITHASGLPVYLHRPTRCCTFSRPYFIGRGSVRNHTVPESAIPCLFQRKVRNEIEKPEERNNTLEGDDSLLSRLSAPSVKVKTEVDLQNAQLNSEQLYEYAKTRNFYKRKKERKTLNQSVQSNGTSREARPILPSTVKLITVPSLEADSKPHQRTFYLNPQGKTSVSILHEFVQKVLKCTVRYFFNETRSSATPFHCVAKLVNSGTPTAAEVGIDPASKRTTEENENAANDELIALGEGFGAGKKSAKLIAAKNALQKLVPGIDFDEEGIAIASRSCPKTNDGIHSNNENAEGTTAFENPLHIFDLLTITDTRIPELSARAGQPSPYLILQEYLKRCSTYGNTTIQLTTRRLRHQMHEFALSVGGNNNERVRVVSTNKREGKQKAAQAMLKKLHPNNSTWGSLLRLYGYEAQMKLKEVRKCKDSVTRLQGISDDKCQEGKTKGEFQPNTTSLPTKKTKCYCRTINKRRKDFQSELPILSEEQLRQLSGKLAAKQPTDDELLLLIKSIDEYSHFFLSNHILTRASRCALFWPSTNFDELNFGSECYRRITRGVDRLKHGQTCKP